MLIINQELLASSKPTTFVLKLFNPHLCFVQFVMQQCYSTLQFLDLSSESDGIQTRDGS